MLQLEKQSCRTKYQSTYTYYFHKSILLIDECTCYQTFYTFSHICPHESTDLFTYLSTNRLFAKKVSGNPDNNYQQTGNGKYCIISQTCRIFHRRRVIPLRKGISQNFPEKFNVFQHFKTDILLLY